MTDINDQVPTQTEAVEHNQQADAIPKTEHVAKKPFPWWIFVPVTTAILILSMSLLAINEHGPLIHITFPDGHGIKAGDSLKYHGIIAGEVSAAQLSSDGASVIISVQLKQDAAFLAKEDARFWIVRPSFSITGISGADTLIGARYISVAPGDGKRQQEFTGLASEPAVINREPNGLEIICQAPNRSGLRSGAPVLYRQCVIGRVISIDLASDASAIEARLYIQADYRSLVRKNTVFWNASGFSLSAGLIGGLSFNVDSIETLVSGGIALAVPNEPGKQAQNGSRFALHPRADEDWLSWNPSIAVLKQNTRVHASDIPNILPVTSKWVESSFWGTKAHKRYGHAIVTEQGLLSLNSLIPAAHPQASAVSASINKQEYPLPSSIWHDEHFNLCAADIPHIPWPLSQMRFTDIPEDALAVLGTEKIIPLPVARLQSVDEHWVFDQQKIFDVSWHGAVVLAKSDKQLIGFISIKDNQARIIPLPPSLRAQLE